MNKATKHKISKETRLNPVERLENLHPYETLLYLAMLASALIFLFVIIAFTIRSFSEGQAQPYSLPKAFTFSTIILLFSNFRVSRVLKSYDIENLKEIIKDSQIGLLLIVSFIFTQLYGWYELYEQNISLSDNLSGAYLYIISGLHILHILGGFLFLCAMLVRAISASSDGIKELIYFTNKFERIKLKLLAYYWNFLDISWLIIFVWFIILF